MPLFNSDESDICSFLINCNLNVFHVKDLFPSRALSQFSTKSIDIFGDLIMSKSFDLGEYGKFDVSIPEE